jgi:DNA-binding NtrC family response regulator
MTVRRARGAFALPASLLRLHRRSRSNLLVLGGDRTQRLAVARAFHAAGDLRARPFLPLDCEHAQEALLRALQLWLISDGGHPGVNPLRASEGGTLYLDDVASLAPSAQRLLGVLVRRIAGAPAEEAPSAAPARLVAGAGEHLLRAVKDRRFDAGLFDGLDKVRVELHRPDVRGVA